MKGEFLFEQKMSSELENYKLENEALKAEIQSLKKKIESDPYRIMFQSSPDIIIQTEYS